MKCRYCNIALAPLRTLTDGEFCCDEHRVAFAERGVAGGHCAAAVESGLIPLQAKLESVSAAIPAAHPSQSGAVGVPAENHGRAGIFSPCGSPRHEDVAWLTWPIAALKFRRPLFNTADAARGETSRGPTRNSRLRPAARRLCGTSNVAAFLAESPEVEVRNRDEALEGMTEQHSGHLDSHGSA